MEATINTEAAERQQSTNKSLAVKNVAKKAMIEGVPCVVIGGLSGMVGGSQSAQQVMEDAGYQPSEKAEETEKTEEVTDTTSTVTPSDINVATSVTDDMSFAQAFAAARQEVGAGGAFEWRGTVYGTYYANEWDAMSSEEQAQFSASAISATPHDNTTVADRPSRPSADDNNLHTVSDQSTSPEPEPSTEAEIQVVDVMQRTEDGTLVTYTQAYVNGDEVIFAEVTGDDIVDGMITDANQNGELDQEDFFDISDQGLRQSQLNAAHEFNNQDNEHLAQLDDFENNADGNLATNANDGELLACRDASKADEIRVISYTNGGAQCDNEVQESEVELSTLSDENYEMGSVDEMLSDSDFSEDALY